MPALDVTAGVHWFLGMVEYVHKFTLNMSEIAKLLHTLLNKDAALHWQLKQQKAFELLTIKLQTTPMLAYYDVHKTCNVSRCLSIGVGRCNYAEERPIPRLISSAE